MTTFESHFCLFYPQFVPKYNKWWERLTKKNKRRHQPWWWEKPFLQDIWRSWKLVE
jgi:hypothetical protein